MERDLRNTPLFLEISAFYAAVLTPGFGAVTSLGNPVPSPDGRWVAVAGSVRTGLDGPSHDRIVLVASDGSGGRLVTSGPNDDTDPQWSPDGSSLTFRSDRASEGRFQLYALRGNEFGEARALTSIPGVVEHYEWSPDGQRVLLVVADQGAEQADALGSGTLAAPEGLPDWMPEVESSESDDTWRTLWVLDPSSGRVERGSRSHLNVWEASWLGNGSVAAVVSEEPGEGAWYAAVLAVIDVDNGRERIVYRSPAQLGYARGSTDGRLIAVQEAVCSDRYFVAGDLLIVPADVDAAGVRRIDTGGVDITVSAWRGDGSILAAGVSGLDSVVIEIDPDHRVEEVWRTPNTFGGFIPVVQPHRSGFVTVVSSSRRPPEVVAIDGATQRTLLSVRHSGLDGLRAGWGDIEPVEWTAPDGWTIAGLIAKPLGEAPYPLLVHVHGGPVGQFSDRWLGLSTQVLLSRGYAVFLPNPRGSTGRGQVFAGAVVGDMGGADATDITSGIDALVAAGLADPQRLGIYGGSYGGFMAAWLPAIDDRFKAAVSFSPVTDWYSEHFGSSLREWVAGFMADGPEEPGGQHHARSPVFAGHALRTPTLLTAGLRDRATPPGQAIEHHRALVAQGVPSDAVIYPLEGHGVRALEAEIDLVTRMVAWFDRFMPA